MSKLFSALKIDAGLVLRNRIVLAPMTRGQSGVKRVPGPLVAKYYQQRSTAGLLVTEATAISTEGYGWSFAPGLYTHDMVEGWSRVNDAVHKASGVIFAQLWHMGRASHSSFQENNAPIVSASAIAIEGDIRDANGVKHPHEVPRPLRLDEMPRVVADYVKAAENAKKAGFDGVELHGANGYLLDQFLQSVSNTRTDAYGGSIENRARLLLEVVDGLLSVFPSSRIGVRLSPNGAYNSMGSEDNNQTFTYVIQELAKRNLGYLHLMDGLGFGFHNKSEPFTLAHARKAYGSGVIIGNVGYTKDTAEQAIESGNADAIAFGRPFITNPDLAERFKHGHPLAADAPYTTWYGGAEPSEKGYTEYPVYSA